MSRGSPSPAAPRSAARPWLLRGGAALAGLAALWLLSRPARTGPSPGTVVPPVAVVALDATDPITIGGPARSPRLIEVFASWCGSCRRAAPRVARLHAESAGVLDVVAVSVDETAEAARAARDGWPITTPVAHDARGQLQATLGIRLLPTFVLLDRTGRVVEARAGAPSEAQLAAWLETARELP